MVYVDIAVGKVGNERKLSINRKRGIIMDKISENTYVAKYDDGRLEPVNVDRLYTISYATKQEVAQNKTRTHKKNNQRHRRRSKKRKQAIPQQSRSQPPTKRVKRSSKSKSRRRR